LWECGLRGCATYIRLAVCRDWDAMNALVALDMSERRNFRACLPRNLTAGHVEPVFSMQTSR
jgi:hypothetical protein